MRMRFWSVVVVCCLLALGSTACRRAVPPEISLPTPTTLGSGAPVAISPDGSSLLVVRSKGELNEGWIQPSDGSEATKVLEFDSVSFYAAYSPDGQRLAWTAAGVWLANADGSGPEQIVDEEQVGPLVWSPDSDRLAVVVGDSLLMVDLTGQERSEIARAAAIRALAWAKLSTGDRLFFVSYPEEQPPFIASVRWDGQDQRQLAIGEAFDLALEDLYVAEPLSAGPLRRMAAHDGSGETTLVASGVQSVSARPPEFKQVAYLKQAADGISADLWLAQSDGTEPMQLTAGDPVLGQLWSPDGQRLYYAVFDFEFAEDEEPFRVQVLDISPAGETGG